MCCMLFVGEQPRATHPSTNNLILDPQGHPPVRASLRPEGRGGAMWSDSIPGTEVAPHGHMDTGQFGNVPSALETPPQVFFSRFASI